MDGTWLSFDEASESLSRAGFELIAKPLARGTFDDCLAVDVDHLETKLPEQLGYPPCSRHSIAVGVIVRPVCRRQPNETRKWIKKKSIQFLEERPNELGKALCDPEDFRRLCRHFFVRPRLESVLSKEPQLRLLEAANLRQVQQLFWMDAHDAFSKRVKMAGMPEPRGCCASLRAEADSLVEVREGSLNILFIFVWGPRWSH